MGYIKDIKIGNGTTNLIEPILYGTTNTAAGTQAKVVSISNFEFDIIGVFKLELNVPFFVLVEIFPNFIFELDGV